MKGFPRAAGASVAFVAMTGVTAIAGELPTNDYPTVARADYVYACMQVNGPTRDVLEKCSCSIDQIAAVLPWTEYEEAETIMSVSQKGGESVSWALTPTFQAKIANLKRAQVEGELRCF
ncbi:MAG: hypothetical protein ACKVP4_10890 [Hyphomicrobium sp.]